MTLRGANPLVSESEHILFLVPMHGNNTEQETLILLCKATVCRNLWNDESLKWFWKQKGFFFFNPRENWSCSILLSAHESQRGQVRSVGGSISVLCHSVPFDANCESQNQKCSNSRENVVYLVFLCAVSYCNNKPPPLRSGDEATSLPRSLDRLRNTIRWQTICFVREREIRQKKKMKECKKYKPSCSTSPPI